MFFNIYLIQFTLGITYLSKSIAKVGFYFLIFNSMFKLFLIKPLKQEVYLRQTMIRKQNLISIS